MNIKSILVGTDKVNLDTVYAFILADSSVISVEFCERGNVGLMGSFPVKGEVVTKEIPSDLSQFVTSYTNFHLENMEEFSSMEKLATKYPLYAETIKKMRVEGGRVILPDIGGMEYGTVYLADKDVPVLNKVQIKKDGTVVPLTDDVPF